jgi:ribosomal-protein-alanine N-acetyltransferase
MEDLEGLHEYASDPEVTRLTIWGPNRDLEESRRFILDAMEKFGRGTHYQLAVERKADGRLVGSIGLSVTSAAHREAEVGYCFRRQDWGKGYATEAARRVLDFGFGELGLHRIFATCRPSNTASARVLAKLGMKQEGFLRKHRFAKGEWQDSLYFAILEGELDNKGA